MKKCTLIFCLCWSCATFATAAIITVDTNADDNIVNGNCTLREAVIAANSNAPVDQCNNGDASGTDLVLVIPPLDFIQLSLGQIQVTEQVTISGPGADALTIGSSSRVFVVNMDVLSHDFKLQSVNIVGAGSTGVGGAVLLTKAGTARFEWVNFTDNHALEGGAVAVDPSPTGQVWSVVFSRCIFSQNSAVGRGGGFAVPETSGGLTRDLNVSIERSTFQSNSAGTIGGAAYLNLATGSEIVFRQSLFAANEAAVRGGGVLVDQLGPVGAGMVSVENCTFAENSAPASSGLGLDDSDFLIANSTFYRNGPGTAFEVTYVGSTVHSQEFRNSVFAETRDGGLNCMGIYAAASTGFNISDDNSCFLFASGDQSSISAGLGGLVGDGAGMRVVLPKANSVVVDGGNPAGCEGLDGTSLVVDQRGWVRPVDGDANPGAICDCGAAERQPEDPDPIFIDGFEAGSTVVW